ncbi:PH domain-containing protein [Melghirimyces algeriensis]|uniref:PH domain-containing protein n=1 Tax=Melghirimyces algeriensis TaxID=910412 RepID=A0A521ALR9_9BACL|nr:PH domain-containing protein [Melghirimyces algeriensis]SMO35600.1 PH domain-containing protein [Melghirimyces algeriensis]
MNTFFSKKDFSFALLTWGPLLIIPAYLLFSIMSLQEALIPIALFLIFYSFTLWIWLGTYYKFAEEELIIKAGPFRWNIPYHQIQRVIKTKSLLSSPALSRHRLEITHQKGHILISPQREKEFLSKLKGKNEQIEMDL